MWNLRSWKTVFVLSIILPAGLFTTFRLTGTLQGPITITETITAETVTWNMSRPISNYELINQSVKNSYENSGISLNFDIKVLEYYENDIDFPAWGNDYVKLRVSVEADASKGFIYSAKVIFSSTETDAVLVIYEASDSWIVKNLENKRTRLYGSYEYEAYVEAYGQNRPYTCSLSFLAAWIFLDENTTTHEIRLTLETIHYNETVYEKIVTPMKLEVLKN